MNAAELRKLHARQPGQCTWCGQPVGRGRQTWCSNRCVESYREQYDFEFARRKVFARDRGVCARCGCDTYRQLHIIGWLRQAHELPYREIREVAALLGVPPYGRDYWEAHHRTARHEGGDNALENLETVCLECHKRETAAQRKRWAEARRSRPLLAGMD
jgi:5-methylcytosine-specific restriction endonuclease McrA